MTLIIPNAAEEAFLDLILAEGYTLRLFTNDVIAGLTPAQIEALTTASFTEATFPGYVSGLGLTGGSWVTTQGDDASTGTYAQQTWTRSSTGTAQTIRGYFVTRTTGGALRWFEYFPGPITVNTVGDTIRVTPTLALDDNKGATVAARGVIARQVLTTNSVAWTTNATTDHVLNNVPVDSSRYYRVHLHTDFTLSAAGRWLVNFHVGGTVTDQFDDLVLTGLSNGEISSEFLWEPATGTVNVDVRVVEVSGTGDLVFGGGATAGRYFWIEDAGPRAGA